MAAKKKVARKKATTKKKAVKKKAATRTSKGKGKAQVIYFPADKLPLFDKAMKKANGNGISKVVISALEKHL